MTLISIIGLAAFVVLLLLALLVMDRFIAEEPQSDKEINELLRRMEQEVKQRPRVRVRAGTSTKG